MIYSQKVLVMAAIDWQLLPLSQKPWEKTFNDRLTNSEHTQLSKGLVEGKCEIESSGLM